MKNIFVEYPKQPIAFVETIMQVVAEQRGIEKESIRLKSRKKEIVEARQLCMAFTKVFTSASLAIIGLELGGKDHATVLHACKTVKNLRETDKGFNGEYESLYSRIGHKLIDYHDNSLVCSQCGHTNILVRGWVALNNNKTIIRDDPEKAHTYCRKCEESVSVILRSDYFKQNNINIAEDIEKQEMENRKKAVKEALEFQQKEYKKQLLKLEKEFGIS